MLNNSFLIDGWRIFDIGHVHLLEFQYLKVYVSKLLGKMVYVDSIGYDVNTRQDINLLWSGWLPTEEITQLSVMQ